MSSIDISAILPRYLRERPRRSSEHEGAKKAVASDGDAPVVGRVHWVPGFVAMPGYTKIAAMKDELLRQGLFAMDVASEIPVLALLDSEGGVSSGKNVNVCTHGTARTKGPLRVLDMCCAPGGKLLSLFDKLGARDTLDGVDTNLTRLETCRALVARQLARAPADDDCGPVMRIFHCDARAFVRGEGGAGTAAHTSCKQGGSRSSPPPPPSLIFESSPTHRASGLPVNKSGRARERKRLRAVCDEWAANPDVRGDYDRVLVDAECTHDGSYRHMKFVELEDNPVDGADHGGAGALRKSAAAVHYWDLDRQAGICALQGELLRGGYRALKPGGELVYSTCSLEERQNEDVVRSFLASEDSAELVPLDAFVRQGGYGADEDEGEERGGDCEGVMSALMGDEEALRRWLECNDEEACGSAGVEVELRQRRLEQCADAVLAYVTEHLHGPRGVPGSLAGTVRFDRRSATSGLFVAKVRKRASVVGDATYT